MTCIIVDQQVDPCTQYISLHAYLDTNMQLTNTTAPDIRIDMLTATENVENDENDAILQQRLLHVAAREGHEENSVCGFKSEKLEDAFQGTQSGIRAGGAMFVSIFMLLSIIMVFLTGTQRLLSLWAALFSFVSFLFLIGLLANWWSRSVHNRRLLRHVATIVTLLYQLIFVNQLYQMIFDLEGWRSLNDGHSYGTGLRFGFVGGGFPIAMVVALKPPCWSVMLLGMSAITTMISAAIAVEYASPVTLIPTGIVCFLFWIIFWFAFEQHTRSAFLTHIQALQTVIEARKSENAAFNAVNHCAKRVMYDNLHWCTMIKSEIAPALPQEHASVAKLVSVIDTLATQNENGYDKCKSVILRKLIAAGTYEKVNEPVCLREHIEQVWAVHPNMKFEVSSSVPDWVLLPIPVLGIILDNAVHNATTHGKEDGEMRLTAKVVSEGRLHITLRNEAGENHDEALRLQAEKGTNFVFAKERISLAEIGSKQSTFLGRQEMLDAANAMDATVELLFVAGTEDVPPHTIFTISTDLQVPGVERASMEEDDTLQPGAMLICADDDAAPRLGYRGLVKRVRPTHHLILGETHDEVKNLAATVLEAAREHGDGNVICIFDQNMDGYGPGRSVTGTDVVRAVRKAGFQGCIFIRSANDEPEMQRMYLQAGADGHLAKDNHGPQMAKAMMTAYKRRVRMGHFPVVRAGQEVCVC